MNRRSWIKLHDNRTWSIGFAPKRNNDGTTTAIVMALISVPFAWFVAVLANSSLIGTIYGAALFAVVLAWHTIKTRYKYRALRSSQMDAYQADLVYQLLRRFLDWQDIQFSTDARNAFGYVPTYRDAMVESLMDASSGGEHFYDTHTALDRQFAPLPH